MDGGRDPFSHFGGPFGSFGGFGGFGSFRGQKSLISSFFVGCDPFEDPFFTSPFGTMFGPSLLSSADSPFFNTPFPGIITHEPPVPNRSRRPVITELNSDDEESRKDEGNDITENPRKHRRNKQEPIVHDPDDEISEKKSKHITTPSYVNQLQHLPSEPQSQRFIQRSTVSYGSANGAYYTSSRVKRTGSDGVMFEECKEADSSSGQAAHRVTRGIHNKGHSVTRRLSWGGHVDSMQTLHNLGEDELPSFNDAWRGNVQKHLPCWENSHVRTLEQSRVTAENCSGSRGTTNQPDPCNAGLALPSTERWSGDIVTAGPGLGSMAGCSGHHRKMRRLHPNLGTSTSSVHHRSGRARSSSERQG